MLNPKLKAGQSQGAAEMLFGRDAEKPWTQRTGAEEGRTPPPPPPETENEREEEQALVRKSYRILRGRIISLPSLNVANRQGQVRVFPWGYFGGATMDKPGELVLIFDGPEGSSTITVSGAGLDVELLPGIAANRVEWIWELGDLTAADVIRDNPSEPVVRGVWIKGGGREWTRSATLAKGGRQP